MKGKHTLILSLLLAFLPLALLKAEIDDHPVKAQLISNVEAINPGEPFQIALHLKLEKGWHIYARNPGEVGMPTELELEPTEGITFGAIQWPTPESFEFAGQTSFGYSGEVLLILEATPDQALEEGDLISIQGFAGWLACKELCIPSETLVSLELPVKKGPPVLSQKWENIYQKMKSHYQIEKKAVTELGPHLLGLAWLGGLILNLMPCVFPVLGIKIMGFVRQAGEDRKRIIFHGLFFTAGVLVSFWALAWALILLRAGGQELGWGFQLQSPLFIYILAVFLFIFGLSLSGVLEIGGSLMGMGSQLAHKEGLWGTFFSGVLATVVATPCAAPFLAPALGAALTLQPIPSLILFSVIGLGLATPYLLLSLFPRLISKLPKPGAWMESFKQFMAFLLYATVVYLVWVLAGQLKEGLFLNSLMSFVFIALSCWIYGRWGIKSKSSRTRLFGKSIGIFCLITSFAIGFPTNTKESIEWEPWSEAKVEALLSQNRIVYVDFTARWCATCQSNKKIALKNERVVRYFKKHNVAALKADWTNQDPNITQALQKFGRSAVPLNLIYFPDQEEPVILPELLTPDIVIKGLERR